MQRHLAAGSTVITALMAAHRSDSQAARSEQDLEGQALIRSLLAGMGKGSRRTARPPRSSPSRPTDSTAD